METTLIAAAIIIIALSIIISNQDYTIRYLKESLEHARKAKVEYRDRLEAANLELNDKRRWYPSEKDKLERAGKDFNDAAKMAFQSSELVFEERPNPVLRESAAGFDKSDTATAETLKSWKKEKDGVDPEAGDFRPEEVYDMWKKSKERIREENLTVPDGLFPACGDQVKANYQAIKSQTCSAMPKSGSGSHDM